MQANMRLIAPQERLDRAFRGKARQVRYASSVAQEIGPDVNQRGPSRALPPVKQKMPTQMDFLIPLPRNTYVNGTPRG